MTLDTWLNVRLYASLCAHCPRHESHAACPNPGRPSDAACLLLCPWPGTCMTRFDCRRSDCQSQSGCGVVCTAAASRFGHPGMNSSTKSTAHRSDTDRSSCHLSLTVSRMLLIRSCVSSSSPTVRLNQQSGSTHQFPGVHPCTWCCCDGKRLHTARLVMPQVLGWGSCSTFTR